MSKDKKHYRRTLDNHVLKPETLMMSYGYDPALSEGSVKVPVFQTSTFAFPNAQAGKDFFDLYSGRREATGDEETGLIYSRLNNPDLQILEERLCLWDKAEKALSFSSGMAAISTTLMTFVRPGDTLLYSQPQYGGTGHFIEEILPELNVTGFGFTTGATEEEMKETIKAALKKGPITLIYAETPANPTNGLVDLKQLVRMADFIETETAARPPVAVDNTLLGPLWQSPLAHGCDLVLYSLTKNIGGHSDLIAGAVLGSGEHIKQIQSMRAMFGGMTDPHTAWLIMRSLETLKIRMETTNSSAQKVAEFLNDHPKVEKVHHLGLLTEDDPDYTVFKNQCTGAGSTFSIEIKGEEAEVFRFLDNLTIAKLAVSLGSSETLISHPATTTHSSVPADLRAKIGLSDSLVRISIGLENADDLIADMTKALSHV